jgi:type IV secretion system protein TrbL
MSPIDSLGFLIAAFIIMICFALIAAMMLLIYVQAYIILNAGVILLGFGGCSFTNNITLKYFQGALSTGVKLFVMILIVGLGQTVLQSWIVTFSVVTTKQICLFIGAAIVLLALVKAVPDMVGDLINGFSWGAGQPLGQMASGAARTAAAAAVGGVVAAGGGYMAVKEAAKLHGVQSSAGTGSGNAFTGTMKNLGSAAVQDMKGRMTGRVRNFGTTGGRMAASMQEQRLSTSPPDKEPSEDERYISPAVDLTKGRDTNETTT